MFRFCNIVLSLTIRDKAMSDNVFYVNFRNKALDNRCFLALAGSVLCQLSRGKIMQISGREILDQNLGLWDEDLMAIGRILRELAPRCPELNPWTGAFERRTAWPRPGVGWADAEGSPGSGTDACALALPWRCGGRRKSETRGLESRPPPTFMVGVEFLKTF